MQGQQIRILALLLAGLGVLALLVDRPWSQDKSVDGEKLYPKFKADAIDRIEVINLQDTTKLVRRDELWMIDSDYPLPADTASVHRALESVAKFNSGQLVSKNTSKFGVFQVDSTGANVKLFAGDEKPAAEFTIGKATPEAGTYIRPAGKDQVYSSPDRLRSLFARNVRAWQDRKMFAMEPTEVTRLTVEHGDTTNVFEKNSEGKWSLTRPDSFAVKPEEMENLLRGVCSLVANAFPDSAITPEEAGLTGRLTLRVKAEKIDGSGIELQVGKLSPMDNLYFAKAADREWIYKIAPYRVTPYFNDPANLKAGPAPAMPDTAGFEAPMPGAALPRDGAVPGGAARPGGH
jgi:hypothetical protein